MKVSVERRGLKGFMEGQHPCEAPIILFGLEYRCFALSKTTFSQL